MKLRRLSLAAPLLAAVGTLAAFSPFIPDARAAEKEATAKPEAESAADVEREREEYYELLQLFADTLDQIDRNYVKDVSRRQLMEAAIEGMLTELDQYSDYIPPEEVERFRSNVEHEFGGVGIQVSLEDGWLTVVSPLVGAPAYEAGLLAGDRILAIDGESTKGVSLDEAVRRMKGRLGTKVKMTVRHAHNNKTETVSLERKTIQVKTVLGSRRGENDEWEYLYDDDLKIGYIRVTAFGRHTPRELREALEQLEKHDMRGLVLDLRFNPGGLLSAAIEVCDLFISEGKIVSTAGRNTRERTWTATESDTWEGFPMAVLVNRYSASASEIVSACLQDHERAVVIGQRTWGKGSVQNIVELEEGKSALKLTTAGYKRPSGENIHRFEGAEESDDWGVKPSDGYEVKLNEEQISELLRHQRQHDIVKPRYEGDDQDKSEGDETEDDQAEPSSGANDEDAFADTQLVKAVEYLRGKLEGPAVAKQDAEPDTVKN